MKKRWFNILMVIIGVYIMIRIGLLFIFIGLEVMVDDSKTPILS